MVFSRSVGRFVNFCLGFGMVLGLFAAWRMVQTPDARPTSAPPARLAGVEMGTYFYHDEQVRISAAYPILSDQTLSELCYQYVIDTAEQFRSDLVLSQDGQAELNLSFTPYAAGDRYLSFLFKACSVYGSSPAVETHTTLLVDTAEKTLLSLPQLFRPNSAFLSTLSGYCRQALRSTGNPEKVASATVAAARSFSCFVLQKDSLRILFDSHKIADTHGAPYAVDVPLALLQDCLRADVRHHLSKESSAHASVSAPAAPQVPAVSLETESLKGHKLVALTFDDGPHPTYTRQVLQLLSSHNAVATFFVLGSRAAYYPELLQAIAAQGSEIGSHGYDHRSFKTLSSQEVKTQLQATDDIVLQATGRAPAVVRPPYGIISDALAFELGRPMVIWSVDPEDWKLQDSQAIAASVLEQVRDGSIILLHDIYQTSADAARLVLDALSEQGYRFVTVSQLLQIRAEQGEEIPLIFP